ncbi:MAG: hypothetical protein FWG64_13395 [Firmicutes bacterium]|nr:hypothetical protein [Bacillota bacterium]
MNELEMLKQEVDKLKKRNRSMFVGLLVNDVWTLLLTIAVIILFVR